MEITQSTQNGLTVLRMENALLELEVAPELGGRILTLRERATGYQFLWKNPKLALEKLPAGSEYDPHFYGGIDELLPNDMPEHLNGVASPDHGELWTQTLRHASTPDGLILEGELPLCGLTYRRELRLCPDRPVVELRYRIGNPTGERRSFLWKLHAALKLEPGDEILCPARTAVVADPQWSKWGDCAPFAWPEVQGQRADLVPPPDGSTDFLYLCELRQGMMGWRRPGKSLAFVYRFDPAVLPYCWYFASYGGFYGHYTGVLEPCTTMPCSVGEAARRGQCSVLEPGQTLETTVFIHAGAADALNLNSLEE